ncbi:bacteriocin immunity protein [Vibrio sp. M250220]|uniref:bacteriocin immunity protein n=1 Tax=Vibrio sp. M250220 TaxID=3020894 RepID=UPI002F3E3A6D
MIELKESITDYTEPEFLELINSISNNSLSEPEEDKLILHFSKIVKHPDGTDLLFYPKDNQDDSPKGIIKEISRWYNEQGWPCFKE